MLACSCSLAWARTLSRAHRSPLSLVSLSHSGSRSRSRTLSLSLVVSLALSLARSHALSRTLSRSLLLSRSLTLSLSVSLSHILALSFSLAHAFVRAHARAPYRHALPQRLAGFLSSALGLSPQLACSRAQQEQSPQHACSPTAPRRRPQQRPAPSASNHGLPARGRRCHGAISAAVRGWASAFKQQLAKESTAASRVRVSWGKRWHTQPSSAPSGSSCGGRESTGCASTNRRDRSLTVLLTKFILSPQTELHPRCRGLDKLVRGRSSSKTSPPVPLAGSWEDGGAITPHFTFGKIAKFGKK